MPAWASKPSASALKAIGIPWVAGAVSGTAQGAGLYIDAASGAHFDAFHNKLSIAFSPSELQMLTRVFPNGMTLIMGERLETPGSKVHPGEDRVKEPSQIVIDLFKRALDITDDPAKAVQQRAFREVAYLYADIASGAAFGVPDNVPDKEKALRNKLQGMTFEQKAETALEYWADGHNVMKATLPFKKRYVLCDSPVVKQLAAIATTTTLNDLEQRKTTRELERKYHLEKRKRRLTDQKLIDKEIFEGPLSEWDTDSENEVNQTRALRGKRKERALDSGPSTLPLRENTRDRIAQAPGGISLRDLIPDLISHEGMEQPARGSQSARGSGSHDR